MCFQSRFECSSVGLHALVVYIMYLVACPSICLYILVSVVDVGRFLLSVFSSGASLYTLNLHHFTAIYVIYNSQMVSQSRGRGSGCYTNAFLVVVILPSYSKMST